MSWNPLNGKTIAGLIASLGVGLLLMTLSATDAIARSARKPLLRIPSSQSAESIKSPENEQCSDLGVMEWLTRERIVFLSNEIEASLSERVIAELLYLDAQSPGKDIYLYINSPGGDVTAGLAIYDVMRSLRSDIVTVTVGEASSMASLLLAGGTRGKRFALPNTRLMIHQPSSGVGGPASDIAIEAKEIVFLKNKLNLMLAELTGQPLKRIEIDTDRDFYLSAQEAKAYGLVDHVVNRLPSASNPVSQ